MNPFTKEYTGTTCQHLRMNPIYEEYIWLVATFIHDWVHAF